MDRQTLCRSEEDVTATERVVWWGWALVCAALCNHDSSRGAEGYVVKEVQTRHFHSESLLFNDFHAEL